MDSADERCQSVHHVSAGANHGWPFILAGRCFRGRDCDVSRYKAPVFWYGPDWGKAIVGGQVYRGSRFPALVGQYVYADGVSGRVGALEVGVRGTSPRTLLESDAAFTAVARDLDGEPRFLTADGRIFGFE